MTTLEAILEAFFPGLILAGIWLILALAAWAVLPA